MGFSEDLRWRLPSLLAKLKSWSMKPRLNSIALALCAAALVLAQATVSSICLLSCSFAEGAAVTADDSCGSCCKAPASSTATLRSCEDCPMPCCLDAEHEQWNAERKNQRVEGEVVVVRAAPTMQPQQESSPALRYQALLPSSPPPPLYLLHCALLT